SGGMADVYLAEDSATGHQVALKVLRGAGDEHHIARFLREVGAIRLMSHPNVVAVYDAGRQGNAHYMAMEYVTGGNLKDLLRRDAPLPEAEIFRIGIQIADALD